MTIALPAGEVLKRIRSASDLDNIDETILKLHKARRAKASADKEEKEAKAALDALSKKYGDTIIGKRAQVMIDRSTKQNRLDQDLVKAELGEEKYRACHRDVPMTKYTIKVNDE